MSAPDGYYVKYEHRRVYGDVNVDPVEILPQGGLTICRLFDEADGEYAAATGWARCHPRDNYRKALGRKIAFGRALKALEEKRGALVYVSGVPYAVSAVRADISGVGS
jgi:hypothetical protein